MPNINSGLDEIFYKPAGDRAIYFRSELEPKIQAYIEDKCREARINENQRQLDKITEWRNRKPVPGELTTASFGSAGAAMEVAVFEQSFKDRIATLRTNTEGGGAE